MKADEVVFFRSVFWERTPHAVRNKSGQFVRDVVGDMCPPMAPKRCWFLLSKWSRKGWYEYGVSLDLGWITDKGKEAAARLP